MKKKETEYTFKKLAKDTLLKAGIPLSPDEIWTKAEEYGYSKKLESSGATPWRTIGSQLYLDTKNNGSSEFTKPIKGKFGLNNIDYTNNTETQTETTNCPTIPNKENTNKKSPYDERDLHCLLTAFVIGDPHFLAHTLTIFHEKSDKKIKGLNHWLHPDIVGVHFAFETYQNETIAAMKSVMDTPIKLYSFELKKEVDISSLRGAFFQAVSNSSWANEGYLVALHYSNDEKLFDEMRSLNNSFGIGFIKLNPGHIEQSEILLPAKEKDFVDWNTIDRLAEENPDFKKFLISIREDLQLSNLKSSYDRVLSEDELNAYVIEKKLV